MRRLAAAPVVAAVTGLAAACGGAAAEVHPGGSESPWRALPTAPIASRADAAAVEIGRRAM